MASLAVAVRVDDGALTLPSGETLAETHGKIGTWYLVDGVSDATTELPFVASLKGVLVGIYNGADHMLYGGDSFLAQQNQRMARVVRDDWDWYKGAYNVNFLATAIHKGAFVKAFQAEPPVACYWANFFMLSFGSGAMEEEPNAVTGAASSAIWGLATEGVREASSGAGKEIMKGGLEFTGKFLAETALGEIPTMGTMKTIIKSYFATRHLYQMYNLSGVKNAEASDVAAQNADLDTASPTFCDGVDLTKPQGKVAESLAALRKTMNFLHKEQDAVESKLTPDDQKGEDSLASAFGALTSPTAGK